MTDHSNEETISLSDMKETITIPNPGSKEAIEKGCRCPVIDNLHGNGAYIKDGVPQFWINEYCPLHGRLKDAN